MAWTSSYHTMTRTAWPLVHQLVYPPKLTALTTVVEALLVVVAAAPDQVHVIVVLDLVVFAAFANAEVAVVENAASKHVTVAAVSVVAATVIETVSARSVWSLHMDCTFSGCLGHHLKPS